MQPVQLEQLYATVTAIYSNYMQPIQPEQLYAPDTTRETTRNLYNQSNCMKPVQP